MPFFYNVNVLTMGEKSPCSRQTFNLAVLDGELTPSYELSEPGSMLERSQFLRLFFYDFSDQNQEFCFDRPYLFLDAEGGPNREKIESVVRSYMPRFRDVLFSALTLYEIDEILGKKEG